MPTTDAMGRLAFVDLQSSDFVTKEGGQCRLCGSSEKRAFRQKTMSNLHVHLNFVECAGCQVVYMDPPLSEATRERIYNAQQYFRGGAQSIGYADYFSEEESRRRIARYQLDRIEEAHPKRGRLLEIGSAAGYFLDEARRRGWEVVGIDPSRPMVQYATDRFGLNIVFGMLENIDLLKHVDLKPATFDVVVAWDTLGNFADPLGNFKKIQALLVPGGAFYFNAYNSKSLIATVMRSNWYCLVPSASHIYNQAALSTVLQRAGFGAYSFSSDWQFVTLHKIMTKLALMFPVLRAVLPQRQWSFLKRIFKIRKWGCLYVSALTPGALST